MIEIIPNWHPIFVHYTIALVSISFIFYVIAYFIAKVGNNPLWLNEFEIASRWTLWAGCLISLGTAIAGLYAFFTVLHDDSGHQAMIIHRNWAIVTATVIILMTIWSIVRWVKQKRISGLFLLGMLLAQILVFITAWYGSEVVYRYGVGVMSSGGTQ